MSDNDHNLVIGRIDLLAKGVRRLTLTHPDGAELPAWTPGSHIDLHFSFGGMDFTRQYSLCGHTDDSRHWQVAVLHVPDGRGGSAYIHDNLCEGGTLRVAGPRNNFPLAPASNYLFVAGGIGITPMLPMIAEAEAKGADWRLIYCGRSADTMAFLDDVSGFGADRVVIQPSDTHGRVDLADLIAHADPATHIYCCGPESMLDAIEGGCADWPSTQVHMERFSKREDDLHQSSNPFEVEFARSGIAATVPADRSILEIAEEAGIDVESSCQEGVCGSCETAVLAGTPDHRDEVLTDDERAACKTMMICVSRACSGRLVLDV
ncbi:PDR/VanB family oxidoreductase [Rhodococcus sp. NPDC056960]|uniref:PDR/VanB family oxidoreductase n=1 Tax=Rhodococcus sp. NPDC056960 TaxID=3345982 RepID=UPI00362E2D48